MADSPPPVLSTCWFGVNKPLPREVVPRDGAFDLEKQKCCEKRMSLSKALEKFKGQSNLYEFDGPLDLLLYRANGELDYDTKEAMSREICSSYLDSLLVRWSKSNSVKTSKSAGKGNLCSLPKAYHAIKRPSGNFIVKKTQAIRWMEIHGELIHPGIVICPNHKKLLYTEIKSQDHSASENELTNDIIDCDDAPGDDSNSKDLFSSLLVFVASICKVLGITRFLVNGQWNDLEEETKDKKGPCDRAAAYLKRTILGWNESGKDSHTPKELFDALTENTPKGCSIYLIDIVKPADYKKEKKNPIPGITSYFDFEFVVAGIVVRKYAGIGKGRLIPSSKLKTNPCDVFVVEQGGWLDHELSWVVLKSAKPAAGNSADDDMLLLERFYRCSSPHCVLTFKTMNDLESHEFEQSHVYSRIKDTILDVAIKEFAIAIETEECAKLAVNQSEIIKDRGDKNTHTQGWSLKESRASRMDAHVQAVAMKFFLDHRAEDKRANAAECCELIKNRMDSRNDYFQFPLSLCPSEKTLMSSFGSWETKRRRPLATAVTPRTNPKINAEISETRRNCTKRKISEVISEGENGGEQGHGEKDEEEEETLLDRVNESNLMFYVVKESSDEIFLPQ